MIKYLVPPANLVHTVSVLGRWRKYPKRVINAKKNLYIQWKGGGVPHYGAWEESVASSSVSTSSSVEARDGDLFPEAEGRAGGFLFRRSSCFLMAWKLSAKGPIEGWGWGVRKSKYDVEHPATAPLVIISATFFMNWAEASACLFTVLLNSLHLFLSLKIVMSWALF